MHGIIVIFFLIGVLIEAPTLAQYAWFGNYTEMSMLQMKFVLFLTNLPWYFSILWGIAVDKLELGKSQILLAFIGLLSIVCWKLTELIYDNSEYKVLLITILVLCEFFPAIATTVFYKHAYLYQLESPDIVIYATRATVIGKIVGVFVSNLILGPDLIIGNVFQLCQIVIFAILVWLVYMYGKVNVNKQLEEFSAAKFGDNIVLIRELNELIVFMFFYTLIPIYSFGVMFYMATVQPIDSDNALSLGIFQSMDYVGELAGTFIVFQTTSSQKLMVVASSWFFVTMLIYYLSVSHPESRLIYIPLTLSTISMWTLDSSLNVTLNLRVNKAIQYENQGKKSSQYLFTILLANLFRNLITYYTALEEGLDYNKFDSIESLLLISLSMSGVLLLSTLSWLCINT